MRQLWQSGYDVRLAQQLRRGVLVARAPGWLWARWLFLRALGLIFLSAFHALADQIHGLIGTRGILPVEPYLAEVVRALPGMMWFWFAPTLLWANASDGALTTVVAAGIVCSLLLVAKGWPRLATLGCTLCCRSCILSCVGMLRWEWFRIDFESGVVELASGDVRERTVESCGSTRRERPVSGP